MEKYRVREEMRKEIRLLKYTYNWKQNLGCLIVFAVLGIFFILAGGICNPIGGLYMMVGSTLLLQGLEQVYFTSFMQSSPRARFYSVTLHMILSSATFFAGYLITVLLLFLREQILGNMDGWIGEFFGFYNIKAGNVLLITGLLGMVTCIHQGVSTRAYISSMIVFVVAFMGLFLAGMSITEDMGDEILTVGTSWEQLKLPFGTGALIGGICLIVGVVISGILRYALFKMPYSQVYKRMFMRYAK